MGITGELVKSVFSKSHGHDSGKRKWSSSVRSYLCGDEHSSILAADDSASVGNSTLTEAEFVSFRSNVATDKSTGTRECSAAAAEEDTASEATVNQPLQEKSNLNEGRSNEKQNSTYKLFQQEDAALTIQSAFRNFMARKADVAKTRDDVEESAVSPSRESTGTSVEVQTGNSSHIFSIEEGDDTRHTIRRRTGAQVLKIQEDWDDSTVSSVISKTRIQNKLEAATRRERALAYAFSQQLRISSKKQTNNANGEEANMGWSWLERWMAARQPEINFMNEESNKTLVRKRILDGAAMEEESCGSNEVSSLVEVCNLPVSVPKNLPKPSNKGRSQAKRSFSRQNSTSSHLSPKESKDEKEKEKRKRQKQPGIKRDVKNATAAEVAFDAA